MAWELPVQHAALDILAAQDWNINTVTDMLSLAYPAVLRVSMVGAYGYPYTGSPAIVEYDTIQWDNQAGYSVSTYKYEVMVAGTYALYAQTKGPNIVGLSPQMYIGRTTGGISQWVSQTGQFPQQNSPEGYNICFIKDHVYDCLVGDSLYFGLFNFGSASASNYTVDSPTGNYATIRWVSQ